MTVREVQTRTGWSRATIYRQMNAGNFPKSLRLSPGSVRWEKREIEDWITKRSAPAAPSACAI
nr:AlpA family phage regulatory protein [Acetobacter sp. DsW_063]